MVKAHTMDDDGKPSPPSVGRAGFTPGDATILTLAEDECWSLLQHHDLGRLGETGTDSTLLIVIGSGELVHDGLQRGFRLSWFIGIVDRLVSDGQVPDLRDHLWAAPWILLENLRCREWLLSGHLLVGARDHAECCPNSGSADH